MIVDQQEEMEVEKKQSQMERRGRRRRRRSRRKRTRRSGGAAKNDFFKVPKLKRERSRRESKNDLGELKLLQTKKMVKTKRSS